MRYLRIAAVLAVAAVAMIVPAGATAATAPGYEEFEDCPSRTVNPNIGPCVVSKVTGGYLKLGTKNTPITDPITLVQSITFDGGVVLGSFDGGRQQVPGGLVGITGLDWLINLFPGNLLKVYAEAELAGPTTNAIDDPTVLPLKVRLINPLLLGNCYIGSNANPITLNLTRGTTNPPPPNTPITGDNGEFSLDPTLVDVFRISDLLLVDNAFSVPAATGCGLLGFGPINALVNLQAGLPSAAGNNAAVQEADAAIGNIEAIYPPAGLE